MTTLDWTGRPSPVVILAHSTLREASQGRLLAMLLALFAMGLGVRQFVAAMALLENSASGLSMAAPLVRLAAVCLVAAVSATLISRELAERRIEIALSAPLARRVWVVGRFSGLTVVAVLVAIAAGASLLSSPTDWLVLAWTFSLALELLLVAAIGLATAIALRRPAVSLLATLVIYLAHRPSFARIAQARPLCRHRLAARERRAPGLDRSDGPGTGADDHLSRHRADRRLSRFRSRAGLIDGNDSNQMMRTADTTRPDNPQQVGRLLAPMLLAVAFAAQFGFSASLPRAWQAQTSPPPPPSARQLKLDALGESRAAATAAILFAQSFDAQAGKSLALRSLDLATLHQWLARAAELAPASGYPTFLTSRIYAAVAPPALKREMLDWVHERYATAPQVHWPWLAHSALIAKHELGDPLLARRYAQTLRLTDPAVELPAWVREMEAFMLHDLDELESARVLLGGLIASGQVRDERALAVMVRDLKTIEDRLSTAERHQPGS